MDIFLLKLVCRLLSYVPLVARKPTKYTDKNLKSSPTFRRHAAVPSVNRESVWKTYDTAWLSKISLINADYGLFWEDLFSLKGYTFIFGTQVCANLRRGGIDPNRRSQNTNQRKRKCLLWHGSIFAKEKRVSAIFHTSTFNLAKFNFGVLYLYHLRLYLNLVLGNVNVTLLSNQAKYVSGLHLELRGTRSWSEDELFSLPLDLPTRMNMKSLSFTWR